MDTREILTQFKGGTMARDQAVALLTGTPLDVPTPQPVAADSTGSTAVSTPVGRNLHERSAAPEAIDNSGVDRYAVTALHACAPSADGLDMFDAEFFGLDGEDAARLGAQQRLLLETVWQMMEKAGHLGARLDGLTTAHGSPRAVSLHLAGAVGGGALAGRLSALLDLRGPSHSVDSGATSFLSALHLALRTLRAGDCAAAVIAEVDTDGGGGSILVKPITAALTTGDPVLAVIRASAAGHTGRERPAHADARLASQARAAADLETTDIVVEESEAGDAQAALGFSAFARTVRQLTPGAPPPGPDGHGVAPPHRRDPQGSEPARIAALRARDASGTSGYVILEEHLPTGPETYATEPDAEDRDELFLLSAPTPRHLAETARLFAGRLTDRADAPPALAALAHALRIGRAAMACRLAVTVRHRGELARLLDRFAEGAEDPAVRHADLREQSGRPPLVEELEETGAYLAALWRGHHLEALTRLWLEGVDVSRGEQPTGQKLLVLPGTAMLRRPLSCGA
ncbi:beta-ketoacyl synthase N-terminal-like domain-containing protein [Streptomyces sp. N35]|uniref:beta-ketoacyl synthase N-terminal-like domain-containing protein n=1 Tax=Streptomyces sp. N35 TaxID=2795730 RepID=UPI0018F51737|nr:beta-ketoacyl synthase N-terminal-like domain-containing protein [Streptomyces sp. N35]